MRFKEFLINEAKKAVKPKQSYIDPDKNPDDWDWSYYRDYQSWLDSASFVMPKSMLNAENIPNKIINKGVLRAEWMPRRRAGYIVEPLKKKNRKVKESATGKIRELLEFKVGDRVKFVGVTDDTNVSPRPPRIMGMKGTVKEVAHPASGLVKVLFDGRKYLSTLNKHTLEAI